MKQIDSDQFEELLRAGTPLIDVRAPVEFQEGAIPGAVNLPLLNDQERHLVGIAYKQQGQEAAVRLGHELVHGEVREARTRLWLAQLARDSRTAIYCFRGGLRSRTVQEWLGTRGAKAPIITGGYKALRRFLLQVLESRIPDLEVVRGPTGSGKTRYLRASGRPFLDLEELARHRGSAFGRMEEPQPTQIDFENAIALAVLKLPATGEPILIEDESRMIGKRHVPEALYQKMKASPVLELNVPLDERVENIFRDYILNSKLGRDRDTSRFEEFRESVRAISRKLGGLRAREIFSDITHCEMNFRASGKLDANREWIRKLLIWYYDPRY